MADHTQTITNGLNVLGVSPGSLWGTFQWNTNWGNDEDVWTDTEKGLTNLTLNLEQVLSKGIEIDPITNTIVVTEDLSALLRALGIWDYVFTKPTTEGREAVYDESTKVPDGDTTWTGVSDASSTWSDA